MSRRWRIYGISNNYQRITRWHPNVAQWVEQGCDSNQFASFPQLAEDVRALREGRPIHDPRSQQRIETAPYVVLEEPWGRDRDELGPFIDFVAHITLPLDIALCRRILRDATRPNSPHDPLDLIRLYLTNRWGEAYQRQLQAGERADLVLDGLRPPNELAAENVETIQKRESQ